MTSRSDGGSWLERMGIGRRRARFEGGGAAMSTPPSLGNSVLLV